MGNGRQAHYTSYTNWRVFPPKCILAYEYFYILFIMRHPCLLACIPPYLTGRVPTFLTAWLPSPTCLHRYLPVYFLPGCLVSCMPASLLVHLPRCLSACLVACPASPPALSSACCALLSSSWSASTYDWRSPSSKCPWCQGLLPVRQYAPGLPTRSRLANPLIGPAAPAHPWL